MPHSYHLEKHYIERSGWLRAAVLGANDGIISVTSLVVGMAASGASSQTLLITCIAGLISGAASMAAGEYISVKSQQDIEQNDLAMEARELKLNPEHELKELTNIYMIRGLDAELAEQVAIQLTAHNALDAHARDEIGILEHTSAQPFMAAFSSALAFTIGSLFPLVSILLLPEHLLDKGVMLVGVISLGVMGALASYVGGASMWKGALRVMIWGIVAMVFSAWIGSMFHVAVA
ncbi:MULTISPECIES: VIT1/CCC1 transporter family protein [Acinetobacter]|jgi:VIT1/CCC1 family predicted Fe2+/Mn2+ transporter|uniref:VIT1/CCC1 transporter family protein n=1 Tax=Acinetobacter TaxID=469 RepID=UPI0015B3CEC8|nr:MULTISPECIES: VIT family protein [Acinetobacter]MBT0887783.1 VIT family protein [Acinetobacter towneri]MDM1283822.1 VIT family protein [Acinetobacter towneri]MDV2454218.1 VIT family protein [Acinetobacter towneri]NWJ93189.1 VIT family protein [Acinetobacter sp. Swhac1]WOE29615.1 VIT family protein [Acinetobacter towneri]